jgi:hypothetical protein
MVVTPPAEPAAMQVPPGTQLWPIPSGNAEPFIPHARRRRVEERCMQIHIRRSSDAYGPYTLAEVRTAWGVWSVGQSLFQEALNGN